SGDQPPARRASANTSCLAGRRAFAAPPRDPADIPRVSALRPLTDGYQPRAFARDRSYRPLTMAGRPARQLGGAPDIAFRVILLAQFGLVFWRRPGHVIDFVERPQDFFGVAVAVEAPLHQQRIGLKQQRHLIDAPVAGRTAYALVHVNAVVEINVVRKAMHFDPLNRSVGAIAFPDRLEIAGVVEQDGMAGHAGFGGRNARGRRSLPASVTVAAVKPIVAHVVLMAELHRLAARNILPRKVRRSRQAEHRRQSQSDQKNPRKQTKP